MSPTLVRDLPDAMELVREVLLAAAVPCGPDVPPKLLAACPRFTAYRSGGQVLKPKLLDRPIMTVIAFDTTYEGARDLAETGQSLLLRAWLGNFHSANGSIGKVEVLSAPSQVQLANTPYGVFRFDATYRLHVRPAP